ncbi:MAG: amidohydrolase [Deltaproteobacteria bacterium]|nr:amidohydrolase [Deltaproteobacteria bacterium]
MAIDIHTHAFHPKIADKVVRQLEEHYRIAPVGNGLLEDLLPRLDRAGIDRAVMHCAATKREQVIPANNWALQVQETCPRLIPFGTFHPDFPEWERELERLAAAGIKGIKLHPDFQGFALDDPRLDPILEAIGERFYLMIHIGDRLPPELNPSSPQKLAAQLDRFPRLKVIAPHFGGFQHWSFVVEYLAGRDLYLDTSSSLNAIPSRLLFDIFAHHPRERILFGSDYPLFDPLAEMKLLQIRLRLSDAEVAELLTNGERLFAA